IVPAGLIVTVDAAASDAVFETQQGSFSVPVRRLGYGSVLHYLDGDVQVERVPTSTRLSPQNAEEHDYPSIAVTRQGQMWTAWQAYRDRGDNVYAAIAGQPPTRLTAEKGDIFRTSAGEDAQGRIHVVWAERRGEDWQLYERIHDGTNWSDVHQITSANSPNLFHKLIPAAGGLHLIWVGWENGQSYLYLASFDGAGWSEPQRIGGPSVWSPDGTTDRQGNLYVAWDSYVNGNYDIFFRRIGASGTPDAVEQVTHSPRFQAHASVAVDGQGRPWLAWDESGANWGKDWNHQDMNRSTVLYKDRSIQVVVKEGGQWKEAPPLEAAVPDRIRRYWELPHLA
ncbi:MAG: TolB family protein, partial [bacterium]